MKFLVVCLLVLGGVSASVFDGLDTEAFFEEFLAEIEIELEREDFLVVDKDNEEVRFSDDVLEFLDKRLIPELCDVKPDTCSLLNTFFLDCNCVDKFDTKDEQCRGLPCQMVRNIRKDAPKLLNIVFSSRSIADIFKSVGETFHTLFGDSFCTCGEEFFQSLLGCAKFYDANWIYGIDECEGAASVRRFIRNLDLTSLNKFLGKFTKHMCAKSSEGKCYNSILQSFEKAAAMVDQSFRKYDELESASPSEQKEMESDCGLFYRVMNKVEGPTLELDSPRSREAGTGATISCALYHDSPYADYSLEFLINGVSSYMPHPDWDYMDLADIRETYSWEKEEKGIEYKYVTVIEGYKDFELYDDQTTVSCVSRDNGLRKVQTIEVFAVGPAEKTGGIRGTNTYDECLLGRDDTGLFSDEHKLAQRTFQSARACTAWCDEVPTCLAVAISPSFWRHRECFLVSTQSLGDRAGWSSAQKSCWTPEISGASLELYIQRSDYLEEGAEPTIRCSITMDIGRDDTLELRINGTSAFDKRFDAFWGDSDYLDKRESEAVDGGTRTYIEGNRAWYLKDTGTTFECISKKYNLRKERTVFVYSKASKTDQRSGSYELSDFNEVWDEYYGEDKARAILEAGAGLMNKVYCDKQCSSQIAETLYPCCYKDMVTDKRMFDYLEKFVVSVVQNAVIGFDYEYRDYVKYNDDAYDYANYTLPEDFRGELLKILHPASYCSSKKKKNPKCAE